MEIRGKLREARLRRKYPEAHGKVVDFTLADEADLRLLADSSEKRLLLLQSVRELTSYKCAFVLEFDRTLRGSNSTIFDCLFNSFVAAKNPTSYEVQQAVAA